MGPVNIPIQAIAVCSTSGDMTPLRFRYKDDDDQLHTVRIDRVLSQKPTVYGGLHCIEFTCTAASGDRSYKFILKYNILSHVWYFKEMLH